MAEQMGRNFCGGTPAMSSIASSSRLRHGMRGCQRAELSAHHRSQSTERGAKATARNVQHRVQRPPAGWQEAPAGIQSTMRRSTAATNAQQWCKGRRNKGPTRQDTPRLPTHLWFSFTSYSPSCRSSRISTSTCSTMWQDYRRHSCRQAGRQAGERAGGRGGMWQAQGHRAGRPTACSACPAVHTTLQRCRTLSTSASGTMVG